MLENCKEHNHEKCNEKIQDKKLVTLLKGKFCMIFLPGHQRFYKNINIKKYTTKQIYSF
jgi:hypothetical protein